MTVRVGISGWRYPPWRGVFYPPKLPQHRELGYASRQLRSIEINGSFYALQRPGSYYSWGEQTPADFVFSVKAPRFITHMKRLRDVQVPVANFLASGLLALGPKLGPLLWQLPPTFRFDAERIETFCAALPRSTAEAAYLGRRHDTRLADRNWTGTAEDLPLRHALEVRHDSFAVAQLYELLAAHNVALVVADTAGKWPALSEITSDFVYVRLHGATELYSSGYDAAGIEHWAIRVRAWTAAGLDCFVYFDNDLKVRAPFDAMALATALGAGPAA